MGLREDVFGIRIKKIRNKSMLFLVKRAASGVRRGPCRNVFPGVVSGCALWEHEANVGALKAHSAFCEHFDFASRSESWICPRISLFSYSFDMRLIGHLVEENAARLFGDFLFVQGIENRLDHEKGEGWGIWILDDDKIPRAGDILADFRKSPDDPKYQVEVRKVGTLRAAGAKEEEAYRKKIQTRRHLFRTLTPYGFGPLTFALICICIAVFFSSRYGNNLVSIDGLFITGVDENTGQWNPALPEVRHGEFWRLLTPIFIHYTALHILFNMLWLRDLGSMIESRQSSLQLLALVIVIGVLSNIAELYFGHGHGPNFGGMSGVVYGLLGYIWLRGKFDPASGLFLHSSTISMMLIWFFVCAAGIIEHVANTAHGVGLLAGMAWGFVSSRAYRR
jgi:GlpG protein